MALGVDKGVEHLLHLAAGENDSADLRHAVIHGVETGGLDIEGYKLLVEREPALADDGAVAVHVVDEICLETVNDLHAVLFAGLPHIRERLSHAVIGDGDRVHAPVSRALYNGVRVGERVQRRKTRMQVQLHALFRGVVRADEALALHYISRVKHNIVVIFAVDHLALNDEMVADFYPVYD